MANLASLTNRVEDVLQDPTNATWSADDIEEALRLALARYNEVNPNHAIKSITLPAAGREVDISSVTGYLEIERVWWDYDSTDPAHPPRWRDFELWPGDILFINDADEPQKGDVVRVWYTLLRTIKDLDSGASTTLPVAHDSILVNGAAGYAALMRSVELSEDLTIDGWPPQRYREWAAERLAEFEAGLARIVRQQAARDSGIAQGPPLDRHDSDGGEWR
jgi:hypothetical protein